MPLITIIELTAGLIACIILVRTNLFPNP